MSKFNSGWYLIYTKPRHEKKVNVCLLEKGITTFLPTRKILRNWHDRRKYIDEPLFPSYIFIYLNDMQSYYDGMNTEGSLYFVRTGKEIARVNEMVVNNIKLATSHSNDIKVTDQVIKPGAQLVITKGVLTGLSCEVIQIDSKQKLLVRIELLQRSILLTVSDEYLSLI
jgi:transcriptional antiterminator RfaH